MRFATILGAVVLSTFAPPTPCRALTPHQNVIILKDDFICQKYEYHTGKPMMVLDCGMVFNAFDQIKDPVKQSVLMAISCVESGFDMDNTTENCLGKSMGLMQIHQGILRYFPWKDPYNPYHSVWMADRHLSNVGSVGAYYLGPRGAKLRPAKAKRYEHRGWVALRQMPWVKKNKQGEPDQRYWKYFGRKP